MSTEAALVIRVPDVPDTQAMARALCRQVEEGSEVVLDFTAADYDTGREASRFVHALLFFATVPPDNRNQVRLVGVSPVVLTLVNEWLLQSGPRVRAAVTIEGAADPARLSAVDIEERLRRGLDTTAVTDLEDHRSVDRLVDHLLPYLLGMEHPERL